MRASVGHKRERWCACAVLAALLPGPALAGPDNSGSWLDFTVEIENESTLSSDDPALELSDTFATVEAEAGLALTDGLGLVGHLTFEPVIDATDDRFFQDLGLYVEELYLHGAIGGMRLQAGKFDPRFDLGNDHAPGLYGDEVAGEYELTERLGVGVAVPLNILGIEHSLAVAAFVADRSPLSDSLITRRGRLRLGDGGVSNTTWPESFSMALTGETGGTLYNLGARFQSAGAPDERDESGVVLGIGHAFETRLAEIFVLGEVAYFDDFDGEPQTARFATLAFEAGFGATGVSAAFGIDARSDEPTSRLAAASAFWNLREDLRLEAGYRYLDQASVVSHTVGIRLTFEIGTD